jgi:hypothetical protein
MSTTRTRLLAGAGLAAAAAGAVFLALRRLRARRDSAPVRIPTAGRPLALVRGELAAEE